MCQASHYIVHSFIFILVPLLSVHIDFFQFSPLISFLMLSKNKLKRNNKCPSCGTPKEQHDFAVMSKHCEGSEEPDLDCDINQDGMLSVEKEQMPGPVPTDRQDAFLQAIRALFSQVGALQLKQQALRNTVTEIKTTKNEIAEWCPNTRHICFPWQQLQNSARKQTQTGLSSSSGHPDPKQVKQLI